MKVVLVRHGEADYSHCISKGYFGMGLNLAALSERGILQAEQVSNSNLLNDAELIVSSPYTRALQTAAIISRKNNTPLIIENDLHEWIPDLNYHNTMDEETELSNDFMLNKGKWPSESKKRWENIDMFSERILSSLRKYMHYKKIIVVTHAAVIYHLIGINTIPFCSLMEFVFTENYKPKGWFV